MEEAWARDDMAARQHRAPRGYRVRHQPGDGLTLGRAVQRAELGAGDGAVADPRADGEHRCVAGQPQPRSRAFRITYEPAEDASAEGEASRRSISKARLSSAIPRGSESERPVSCSSRRIRCRTVLG